MRERITRTERKNFLPLFLVLSICFAGCSIYSSIENPTKASSEPKHVLSWLSRKDLLTDFTDDEEKSILEAFNVVIPENENAYVYSLCFYEENDYPTQSDGYINFILEIGGVEDYEAFFEANTSRIKENGLAGISYNELFEEYPPKYYITYWEMFSSNPKWRPEEDKEMASALETLWEELSEARKNEAEG